MEMKDEELVEELKRRLDEKNRALYDLREATQNLEETNSKLQASEQLKSNFLSNIRNEINNPLTALIGLSGELASAYGLDEEKIREIASMLHLESHNLDFQLRNIFSAADLEAGEAELHITKTDVYSVIEQCVNVFSHFIDQKKINLKVEGDSPLWMHTDAEKLRITILNLISNGIVFNKEGGGLEIHCEKVGDELNFSVRDDGIGIAAEHHKLIFDRFWQVDSGAQKKYGGHGLGLSVALANTELLDGTITLESKEGKGSLFTLTVPDKTEADSEGISSNGTEFFFDEDQEF